MYKTSIDEILKPMSGEKIDIDDPTQGAEQILIEAVKSNKNYAKLYSYDKYPYVKTIMAAVGGGKPVDSVDFAVSIFRYQVNTLNIPKNKADGILDPPMVERVAKIMGIDITDVIKVWKGRLKGVSYSWIGRRDKEYNDANVFQEPVKSAILLGGFTGAVSPNSWHPQGHWGIDYGNVAEGTPIYATAPGVVYQVGDFGKGGLGVMVSHGNGIFSYYAHLNSINVKSGQAVDHNTIVGGMGKTGNSNGVVHLHFGIKQNGTYVDPKKFFGKPLKV